MREKLEQVKKHIVENKWVYISGGVGLAAGAAGMYFYGGAPVAKATQTINGVLNYKSTQNLTQITILERRGHPGNIIRCNETGELFASQNRAADLLGIDSASLSRHLNGKLSSVGNYTFTNLGEAA